MDRTIFDDVVEIDYGQVDLLWTDEGGFDGDFDRFFAGQVNGLVGGADPHRVYFHHRERGRGVLAQGARRPPMRAAGT